jgi:hypothetical protein
MARTAIALVVGAGLIVLAQVTVNRRESSAETTAIAALRAITSGQAAFVAVNRGYAASLTTLAAGCGQQGFVSPDLRADPTIRRSYELRIHVPSGTAAGPADCNGIATAATYYATATPLQPTSGATRAFAVDPTGTIWVDSGGVAPTPPFAETATTRRLQ